MPLNLIGPYSVRNPQTIHDEPYFDKPNEDFDLTLVGNIHPKVGSLPGTSYKYTLIIEDYNSGSPGEIFTKEFKCQDAKSISQHRLISRQVFCKQNLVVFS